jgi:hypothetical protein
MFSRRSIQAFCRPTRRGLELSSVRLACVLLYEVSCHGFVGGRSVCTGLLMEDFRSVGGGLSRAGFGGGLVGCA